MARAVRRRGERHAAILVGSGVALWLGWVSGSVTGHLAGAVLGDPRLYGADVVVPAFFAIMLAPLWPGWAGAWPWAIAAGVAVAAHMVLPGYWHVIAGRSEEHTSELQSLMRISYAVFCLKKQKTTISATYHMR